MTARTGAAVGLGAVVAAAMVVAFNAGSDRGYTAPEIAIEVAIGLVFVVAGVLSWWRRPDSNIGRLMVLTGLAWLVQRFVLSDHPVLFTLGLASQTLPLTLVAHVVVAFPSGRLSGRLERYVVAGAYLTVVLDTARLMVTDYRRPVSEGCPCPRNLLLIRHSDSLRGFFEDTSLIVVLVTVGAFIALIVLRWRHGTPAARRVMAPVFLGGGIAIAPLIFSVLQSFGVGEGVGWWWNVQHATVAAVPIAFLAWLLRSQLAKGAVSKLVVDVGDVPAAGDDDLRRAVGQALGDPTVTVARWHAESQSYVDGDGLPVELPEEGRGQAITLLERNGRRLGVIIHDEALVEDPALLRSVGAAAGLVLENQRLHAEVLAQLKEVRASRARIVAATDAERRRMERNLHDGAQQRLLTSSLALRMARREMGVAADPALHGLIAEAGEELDTALQELRELARGLHPAILAEEGLGVAVASLVERAPVAVTLSVDVPERPPPAVEVAAYYVVSEALANAAKHAQAQLVTVSVRRAQDRLVVEVIDDGVGGARPAVGSGLEGLSDRVAALNGQLTIHSPPGCGTRLVAEVPLGPVP